MTTKIGSQQKQSPEEGIPEGGPIPLHRDTTRSNGLDDVEEADLLSLDSLLRRITTSKIK